jgi:hypothetical protein
MRPPNEMERAGLARPGSNQLIPRQSHSATHNNARGDSTASRQNFKANAAVTADKFARASSANHHQDLVQFAAARMQGERARRSFDMDKHLSRAAEAYRSALQKHEQAPSALTWEALQSARRDYLAAKVMAKELCGRSVWP